MRRPARRKWWLATMALVLPLVIAGVAQAQDAAGFDGYVQSGTCSTPTGGVRVNLESGGTHDVEPYAANSAGVV